MTHETYTAETGKRQHGNSGWNDAEVEKLRHLATQNITASVIAQEFPGKTRNAILGKLNRLGIHIRPAYGRSSESGFWRDGGKLQKLRSYYHSPLGYSLSEIAAMFGCGLSTIRRGVARMRAEDGTPMRTPPRASMKRGPKTEKISVPMTDLMIKDDLSKAVPIGRLDPVIGGVVVKSCRFPVQGHGWDMLYCGHVAFPGRPYCIGHTRRAYTR